MAKVGTVHVEIKPVLNQEALDDVCAHIEEAVAAAVSRGLATPPPPSSPSSLGTTWPGLRPAWPGPVTYNAP